MAKRLYVLASPQDQRGGAVAISHSNILSILQNAEAVMIGDMLWKDKEDYERVSKIVDAAIAWERERLAKLLDDEGWTFGAALLRTKGSL